MCTFIQNRINKVTSPFLKTFNDGDEKDQMECIEYCSTLIMNDINIERKDFIEQNDISFDYIFKRVELTFNLGKKYDYRCSN